MLITYSQFQTRQAIKNSNLILSPRTIRQESIRMPHTSMIHYLDWNADQDFPERTMRQLRDSPKKKRIPIHHILDISEKNEVQMLQDRYIPKKVRIWQRTRMNQFRPLDLFEIEYNDMQANGVFNYNLLRHQYKYKTTVTSNLSRYMNIMTEYWRGVNRAANKHPGHQQFVTLTIPSAIPSRNVLDRLINLPPGRFTRIVTSNDLHDLINLYKFITPEHRASSTMADLTDDNTQRVTLELTYKGYSVFCKLSHLVSLFKDNELENKTKIPLLGVQKMFMALFLKSQFVIESKLQGGDGELSAEDKADALYATSEVEDVPEGESSAMDMLDDLEDPDAGVDYTQQEKELAAYEKTLFGIAPDGVDNGLVNITDKDINFIFDGADDDLASRLEALIDHSLGDLEGGSDALFLKSLAMVDKLPDHEAVGGDESKGEEEPENPHIVDHSDENIRRILHSPTIQERQAAFLLEMKGHDAISTAEMRAFRKTFEKRETLVSPYMNQLLDHYKQVRPEDLQLPDTRIRIDNDLVGDHLKHDVLANLDKAYIKGPMRKHIAASVAHLENYDAVLKDYQVEKTLTSVNRYEMHKITIKPFRGKESTLYFRVPLISDEGEFIGGGVKYRMRRQRSDMVLRKISPIRVGISTDSKKLFIGRTERKAFDPYDNITNQIKNDYLDGKGNITKIAPGNRYQNTLQVPNIYAAMSRSFNDVTTPTHRFFFNYAEITKHIEESTHQELLKKELLFIGHDSKAHVLVIDKNEQIFDYSSGMAPIGKLETLLQLDTEKIPKAFSTINVLGDEIPLGVALSYYMGLKDLVAVTRSTMEVFPPRKQVQAPDRGVVLSFEDAKVVITCPTISAELLFAGFLFYKAVTKQHTLESFYTPNIYLEMMQSRNCDLMHLKELDLLYKGLIDPITKDALIAQNEPTEYLPLLLRANQLLEDFHHLDINDPTQTRIRGYDRVPGLIQRALSEAVRAQYMRGGRGKIEMDPYQVWKYVTQDTTVKVTEDNNPVTDTKEIESITFTGRDGLSRTATPEKLRRFHKNDKELMAEATVDSTDVALNASLTPNAKIKSLIGDVDMTIRNSDEHPEMLFSTSMLLTPMAEHDDPKRINGLN